jgi:hypothetical protein
VPSQNASVGPAGPCPSRIFSYCITRMYYCRSAEWQAAESRARPWQTRPGQATAARSARSRWPCAAPCIHPSRLSRRVGVACASRRRAARPRSPDPRRRTDRIPRPVDHGHSLVRTPARWRIAPCRRSRLEGGAATDPSWPWPLGGSSWGLL